MAIPAPLSFAYYNNPDHECVVRDARVLAMPAPLVLARRLARHDGAGTYLRFEVFQSLDHAAAWIVRMPPHERCYLAVVDKERPVEMFFDAEIRPAQLRAISTVPELDFDRQIVVLVLWLRCMVEALSGVALPRGAWLWRADRDNKFSCHGHFPQCVFESVDVLSSYMRVLEDVLYTHRATMVAAGALHYRDTTRAVRRRQACISDPTVLASAEDELVIDFGVTSSVRQMRMALNRSSPATANPLVLWQPAHTRVDDAVAAQSPVDVGAPAPSRITAGDALRLTSICPPDTGAAQHYVHRTPLGVVAEWERAVDRHAACIARTAPARAEWTQLIEDTWHAFVDAGAPRLAPASVGELAQALDALLVDADSSADGNVLSRWRMAWWCALAMRWRCPNGHVGVDALDTGALLGDIQTIFVPVATHAARPLDDAMAVLRFVNTAHNAALYGRLDIAAYALADRATAEILQRHRGALPPRCPARCGRVAVGVFPLEVAGACLAEPHDAPIALTSLDALAAIDTLADFQQQHDHIFTMMVHALLRGPVWHAPAAFMAQWLCTTGARGGTRFDARRMAAVDPKNQSAPIGDLQNLADHAIDALVQPPSLDQTPSPFYVRQGSFAQPGWLPHRL